jgi:hypothetical protein
MRHERTLRQISEQETRVRSEDGATRSAMLEASRKLGLALFSEPARAKKLTNDVGLAITQVYVLEADKTQLSHAHSAIEANGSDEGVAVAPLGRRLRINPGEDLDGGKHNRPLVASRRTDGK